jgi:DnaK suppressor protein
MDSARAATLLEARRVELAAELEALRKPVREPGAQLQYGKRVGDHTNDAIEQRTRGMAAERLQQVADGVARAIEKLSEGSYGRCDGCGRPIPDDRLEALPWASLCIACKGRPQRPTPTVQRRRR